MLRQRWPAVGCRSRCDHVLSLAPASEDDDESTGWSESLQQLIQRASQCTRCDYTDCNCDLVDAADNADALDACGRRLWMCVHVDCGLVLCGGVPFDHSRAHFVSTSKASETAPHCLTLNVHTLRVWCYCCQTEVYLDNNEPPLPVAISPPLPPPHHVPDAIASAGFSDDSEGSESDEVDGNSDQDDDQEEEQEENGMHCAQVVGLTGLRNLGNTCFLNATLQALSNLPPLTAYFADCEALVPPHALLATSFSRLLGQLWHAERLDSVAPVGVLHALRLSHPQFRGCQQHDSQEVLRCLLDALHCELRLAVPEHQSDASTPPIRDARDDEEMSGAAGDMQRCVASISSDENDDDSDDRDDLSSSVDGRPPPASNDADADLPDDEDTYQTADSGVSDRVSSDDDFAGAPSRRDRLAAPPSPSAYPAAATPLSDGRGDCDGLVLPSRRYRYTSIVSHLFDGRLVSSVRCLSCARISSTLETFQDLSLSLPAGDHVRRHHSVGASASSTSLLTVNNGGGGWLWWLWSSVLDWWRGPCVSLYDCLDLFFSCDQLTGDNMYSCGACHKLRDGVKYSRVLRLPEVMTIHLKRFRHELFSSSKVATRVTFPLSGLQMRGYTHSSPDQVTTYDLAAVVCHHGMASAGHYTTLALNHLNGSWYEYDDSRVTAVSADTVANCQAYVLFYRKSSAAARQRRVHTSQLMSRASACSSLLSYYVSRRWISRFNTFAEPGAIDNWDVLCAHGGVRPDLTSPVSAACARLPLDVWQYLHDSLGGAPVCHQLTRCRTCDVAWRRLLARRRREMAAFTRSQQQSNSHALSAGWFRRWQEFVSGRCMEVPGRIDNVHISTTSVSTHQQQQQQRSTCAQLRPGSDHVKVSSQLWNYFHAVYGGGPEVTVFLRAHHATPSTVCRSTQCSSAAPPVFDTSATYAASSDANSVSTDAGVDVSSAQPSADMGTAVDAAITTEEDQQIQVNSDPP